MTISSENRVAGPYIGNDAATAFPFAFKVFAASDLQVVRTDAAGVESTLTLNTDYTVTLNGNQDSNPGGTITLLAVLATGYKLTITSNIAPLQATDLTNQGGFYPKVITNALDKLTILIQQIFNGLNRSIKLPISNSDDGTLPAGDRANTVVGFDALGKLKLLALQTGTSLVDLAASAGASLIGFVQSGSGAVERTVEGKLREVVSVKDFGAVGDGVTDDTAAILAAINSNSSFIEVFLPPGTYRLAYPLIIDRQNLTLTGAGRASTLYPDSGVTAIEVAKNNGVSLTVFRDFRVYGNTNATGGIVLGGEFVAFCQLRNLSIENFTSTGSFGVKMSKVQELDIDNCYIADNYNNIIFPNMAGNYATSCHIHGEGGYIGRALNLGILLEKEAASLTVSDIVIENNDAGAIAAIGKGSQVNIHHVHFEANTGPNTIYVSGTAAGRAKFTVSECFFFDEPSPILRTDYVMDSVVENNSGLIGAGKIITTANSAIEFRFNRAEDVSLTQDAITLYESLLGKITYIESDLSTGAVVRKIDQLRFPAVQVPSPNANTLDDYEEGSWTPALTCGTSGSISLSAANGKYTKIGNLVTVFATVTVSGVSSPTGELRLSGLPFAVGGFGGGTFSPFAYGFASAAMTALVGVASAGNTYAVVSKYAAGGVANLAGDVQGGAVMHASFSYVV